MDNLVEVRFRLAVKAFIVNDKKILLIKRSDDDVQSPGIWELPGGRLELGEDPILGLIREIREETGFYVIPSIPLSVRHFVRQDNQVVTMLVFYCKISGGNMQLSDEHSLFSWINIDECKSKINEFYFKEVDIFNKLNLHNLIDI